LIRKLKGRAALALIVRSGAAVLFPTYDGETRISSVSSAGDHQRVAAILIYPK
jgi:hypothetical protein